MVPVATHFFEATADSPCMIDCHKAHLYDCLALAEHGGGIEVSPVLPCDLIRHPQEEIDPLLQRNLFPLRLGLQGRLDGLRH